MRRAVERLAITYPVAIDSRLELWDLYGNQGWPARYLWDAKGALFSLHYGEGAYQETELEIQELLGIEPEPLPPQRPEDAPGALLPARPRTGPAPTAGPTRPAPSTPCSRARARRSPTAACSRSPIPAATS